MKKIIALFLVIAITAAFAVACKKDGGEGTVTSATTSSESTSAGTTSSSTTATEAETTEERVVKQYTAGEDDNFRFRVLKNDKGEYYGVAITTWKGSGSELNIPSAYAYNDVTYSVIQIGTGSNGSINKSGTENLSELKKITVPSTVTLLSPGSFTRAVSLETVELSEGLTSIGATCFWTCTALKNITLPSTLQYIGALAFSGCTSLTSIVVPSSVTEIGDQAFSGCTALTSVTMPKAFQADAASIFSGCPNVVITYVG